MSKEHDNFFRTIQSIKENALDLIESTFPKNILQKLNLKTLELDKESYVDENLKEFYTDLVYNCRYSENKTIKITILFEHKSFKPDNEYLQLLRYILNIWNFEEKNKKPISLVIPVIFYHGEKKWFVKDLVNYFENIDPIFFQFLPRFNYILTDLAKFDDNIIKNELFKRDINKAFSLLLKHVFNKKYIQSHLLEIFGLIKNEIEDKKHQQEIMSILSYIFMTTDIDADEVKDKISQISIIGGDIAMTTAIKLKEQGKLEGKLEGKYEGKYEDALNMLEDGLSYEKIMKYTGLSKKEVEKIVEGSKKN